MTYVPFHEILRFFSFLLLSLKKSQFIFLNFVLLYKFHQFSGDSTGKVHVTVLDSDIRLWCHNILLILHGCEVRIDNSIPKVTAWHHEAVPSDAKQRSRGTESRGTEFLSAPNTHMFDFFSCIPFDFKCFILKVAFITTHNDVDVGNVLI